MRLVIEIEIGGNVRTQSDLAAMLAAISSGFEGDDELTLTSQVISDSKGDTVGRLGITGAQEETKP